MDEQQGTLTIAERLAGMLGRIGRILEDSPDDARWELAHMGQWIADHAPDNVYWAFDIARNNPATKSTDAGAKDAAARSGTGCRVQDAAGVSADPTAPNQDG